MARPSLFPLSPALGAEIDGIDLAAPIGPDTAARLRQWLDERLVLRFRRQRLSDPQLLALAGVFGEIDPPGPNPLGQPYLPAYPALNVISNLVENGRPLGSLGHGEAIWHGDQTYQQSVPLASLLFAIEVPASGGATYWANQYAAYDSLPDSLKRRVDGLIAVHDASRDSSNQLRKGHLPVTDPRQTIGARHPLVARHPRTGRRHLFLGRRRNAYIPGLDLADSEELLDLLWQYATDPALVWRQDWQEGDLLIWHNHGTVHRRDSFDPAARRLMHRAQVRGFAPEAAAA